jgi:hypothetical protein
MAQFYYTGRANTFNYHGKIYANPETYARNPKAYDASYDKPITGMTREKALDLAQGSNMHSFREGDEDVLEAATSPLSGVVDHTTVKPESLTAPKK